MSRRSGPKQCGMFSLCKEETESAYRRVFTYCNDVAYMGEKERGQSLKLVTCPKCSAAIGKKRLGQLKGRVELVRHEKPINGYTKSSYDVLIDGTLRGYVLIENGWGKTWELRQLPSDQSGYARRVHGDEPRSWDAKHWLDGGHTKPESVIFWPVHFHSKEAMAVAALAAYEAGDLPTAEEQEAKRESDKERKRLDDIEREANRIEREKERQAQAKEREERVATAWLGLTHLEARPDLSNLERAGLEAIKRLLPDMGGS